MRLCIAYGRFPADNLLGKNHVQDRYPPSRKPLEPFRPSVCGVRAGAEYHGRPR